MGVAGAGNSSILGARLASRPRPADATFSRNLQVVSVKGGPPRVPATPGRAVVADPSMIGEDCGCKSGLFFADHEDAGAALCADIIYPHELLDLHLQRLLKGLSVVGA